MYRSTTSALVFRFFTTRPATNASKAESVRCARSSIDPVELAVYLTNTKSRSAAAG